MRILRRDIKKHITLYRNKGYRVMIGTYKDPNTLLPICILKESQVVVSMSKHFAGDTFQLDPMICEYIALKDMLVLMMEQINVSIEKSANN